MTLNRKIFYSTAIVAIVSLSVEGAARLIWRRLETRALQERHERGEATLRNDAVNYLRVADGIYGYTLRPNTRAGAVYINGQGFHQREEIPVERRPGFLRIACLGESTTFGSDVDTNYPAYLRKILESSRAGFKGYEVINAGVPGWVSDQIALRVQHQLAAFRPDAVFLYVGWNDFQSYDPFGPPPPVSYLEQAYGGASWKQYATSWLKSVALLSALYHSGSRDAHEAAVSAARPVDNPPEQCYRFLLGSLGGIVAGFRRANPGVKIFLCTLVGRWPQGTPHQWAHDPAVWWMDRHRVGPEQAAERLAIMNDQLRRLARRENLILVDDAQIFAPLDRARLQWDWAHMYAEGYELLAWTMYSALHEAGIAPEAPSQRETELLAKYRLPPETRR
ncbi:MAG TPA: SGNH/GDSL hydrolase family protein [Bryobacterales bacterium]|jgi:lysophospholipase L1-like esterase|nr:SGNH/GDSL hydrolase family protein [Bryobacterales bacterium]